MWPSRDRSAGAGVYGHKRPEYLKVLSDEALNLVRLATRPVLVYGIRWKFNLQGLLMAGKT